VGKKTKRFLVLINLAMVGW